MLNEISILLAFKEHEISIVYNDLRMDLKLHTCALTETRCLLDGIFPLGIHLPLAIGIVL